ncbi:MAG: creatininase family protein, partial [Bdellovibrionaceae bacterium]|nr:creatininase family protein [Pseudobdellovibrionaceae bacterium]
AYEREHFGSAAGYHATVSEISLTMYTHADAYKKIPAPGDLPPTRQAGQYPWPLSARELRCLFPDGRIGSLPQLANAEHGRRIFDIVVDAICQNYFGCAS